MIPAPPGLLRSLGHIPQPPESEHLYGEGIQDPVLPAFGFRSHGAISPALRTETCLRMGRAVYMHWLPTCFKLEMPNRAVFHAIANAMEHSHGVG